MMTTLQILFWLSLFLVFYTHLGYGILLYMLVKLKELFVKPVRRQLPPDKRLPDVTLFITAFNEEEVVDEKMRNCLGLDYPATGKLAAGHRPLPTPAARKNGRHDTGHDAGGHAARSVYRCQYDAQPRSDTRNSPCF